MKQSNTFETKEVKRAEKERAIIRIVFENYWRHMKEMGRYVLGLSVTDIAGEIKKRYGGDLNELESFILDKFLKSSSPEDLKPETLDILLGAISYNELIYIWTVGDAGAYNDEARHISYPEFNFQQIKIDLSGVSEQLSKLGKERFGNDFEVGDSVTFNISAENKQVALENILSGLESSGPCNIYIADDQQGNLFKAEELRNRFPSLKINTWWINNSSELRNLAAFKGFIEKERERLKDEKIALVFDWDDTLYDEQKRLSRASQEIAVGIQKLLIN